MCHTEKSGSHLTHLKKWVTLGKKEFTLGKLNHTCKNGSHSEKRIAYVKGDLVTPPRE